MLSCGKFCKADKLFWRVVYIRDWRVKNPGEGWEGAGGDKREKKNYFHFFIELIWDYWISSKNGVLDT